MVRVIATFIAVWLAVGAIGVLVRATIVPIPTTAVASLVSPSPSSPPSSPTGESINSCPCTGPSPRTL